MPTIHRQPGIPLAYDFLPGRAPVVVFLPGFASDMAGTKAIFLRAACAAAGQAMLRLDYSGHGKSGGDFTDGTISSWAADAAAIIAATCDNSPLLLVGSSMGGWIALLLGQQFSPRLHAMLLVAPAPDFTEKLIRPQLSAAHLELLQTNGVIHQPSNYGEPTPITLKLLEDGARHQVLGGPIAIAGPVRILHGMNDTDVPWEHSLSLLNCLDTGNVKLTLIKDGDHRLARDHDLILLRDTLFTLLGENAG